MKDIPIWQIGIAIVVAVLGLIIWLIQQLITKSSSEAALKFENDSLKQEKSNLQEQIKTAKTAIANLEEKTSDKTHKEKLLSKYTFNERLGFYEDKQHRPFCKKCLLDKEIESPLHVGNDGWRCNICGSYYDNPNYRPTLPNHTEDDGFIYGR